jgi:hypothetical protein
MLIYCIYINITNCRRPAAKRISSAPKISSSFKSFLAAACRSGTNFFPPFTFGYGRNLITTVAALIRLVFPLESTPPPHPSIS